MKNPKRRKVEIRNEKKGIPLESEEQTVKAKEQVSNKEIPPENNNDTVDENRNSVANNEKQATVAQATSLGDHDNNNSKTDSEKGLE